MCTVVNDTHLNVNRIALFLIYSIKEILDNYSRFLNCGVIFNMSATYRLDNRKAKTKFLFLVRLKEKLKENIGDMQFGFRCGVGTTEALFRLKFLMKSARDVNSDILACIIDFEKAFDKVLHGKLSEILQVARLLGSYKYYIKHDVQLSGLGTNRLRSLFSEKVCEKDVCILSPYVFLTLIILGNGQA